MSSSFPLSLAKPTPVHFQQHIPDCRTISGHGPHKTGVDTFTRVRGSQKNYFIRFCRNSPIPKLSGSIVTRALSIE